MTGMGLRTWLGLKKPNQQQVSTAWAPVVFDRARPKNAALEFSGRFDRRKDICRLIAPGGVGVELGVAKGQFSETLLVNSQLEHLYSIDMWAGDRGHDVDEYREALRRLDTYRSRSTTIKLRFDEALALFPDAYFDFIYIDGYAHTGEEAGQTLVDWWPKLKPGGIFSGDDYSPHWPLVMDVVDRFSAKYRVEVYLIEPETEENEFSRNPTWFCFKPKKEP